MTGPPDNHRRRLCGLLALGSTMAVAHPAAGGEAAGRVSLQLRVGGRVQRDVLLTPETLGDFAKVTIADTPLRGRTGDALRVLSGYSGIRLTDLLDKAQIVARDHNDLKKTIVVATATDDYKAVFSWNELYNTAIGEGVYVLVTKEGKPLGDEEGRFALISLQDSKTGPRHVRWLADIRATLVD
ncbi:sulfite oxidase-like oxidoreductase [Rhodoferax sp. GW822-FHT02A01]|uniref:sulfite oxidase-like oxidoreductase n=1 Tax=Rhodoferax sp. GW822-FHT02A01 TaxID=3141537 RepID=UPI00315CE56B